MISPSALKLWKTGGIKAILAPMFCYVCALSASTPWRIAAEATGHMDFQPARKRQSMIFQKAGYAARICKRNIEMTPVCKIEVTLPQVLGSRGVHRGRVVDEQAGVQPSRRSAACSVG